MFQVRVKLAGESREKTEVQSESVRVVGYIGRSIIKRNRRQGSRQGEPRAGMVFQAIDTV